MARVKYGMHIKNVDAEPDLFEISNIYSPELVEKITATDWMDQPWTVQPNQESWLRRRIDLIDLPWADEWTQQTRKFWFQLSIALRQPLLRYEPDYTYFWIDLPGFTCDIHTDGTLPGAMQIAWHGQKDLSTRFYQDRERKQPRFVSQFEPNNGYVMINPDAVFTKTGSWHDMPVAVPDNEFRVTSYTLIKFL
jgi:hypothetical protein